MNKKIAAVCESEKSSNSLKEAANILGFDLVYEIQNDGSIKNELSMYDIEDASIVLFVTSDSIEGIEKIDRFIDREFYEVEPKYIISDAKSIVNEILIDLN
ncbi:MULTISPECIES: PTS sugar transporter subunit IIBC [unclassified Clostridioides]|uniref:PTS sugar transporter subunit IIBC n=1 Tax=unclassified Clostridioides TaxID=2635829 RepID=UPI001D0C41EA|nr:PTS sugar transporter subunit IIBC [Clostridioides sp. ES-S-0001-02]MCC0640714.1 PTS sugar transporter subunit IIBC [Clostridioides sp. ES-S-0049-03]MCC0653255.1 PTS sugar transporter subunit IIBC [Clostridioides sp. ES-S-0001-03]MCC0656737.1 PTS sugar transporter subunit IIBC [Clostridioides sp. ES-S-0123-01]MCC0672127.1 PTS sugar transporter subunit IIBC [Clostridioides sp. ES-S-0145-01]MCC0676116.1 PTS sugar transporter subunit IIBC [Clostridioides sp. ES-W-0018-02]MCC0681447.1 PTS suga